MANRQPPAVFDPWIGTQTPPYAPEKLRDARAPEWLYNPWTGTRRAQGDIETDPHGFAIWLDSWGPLHAAPAPRAADGVIDKAVQYNAGGIECIDAIQAALTPEEFRGFLKGNVIKYTWRERHKGGEESLRKAQWYLARLIALGLALGAVSGCASDFASPFDKPDETTQPVTCSPSTPCQQ